MAAIRIVTLLATIGLVAQIATDCRAQDFPSRVIRYVVTDQAGTNTDTLARIIARELSDLFGKQVMVDNRAGAAGNIAAEYAGRAPADGYTLVQLSMTHTANVTIYKNLAYDLVHDFAPVTLIASAPSVLVVPPSSPFKSMDHLIRVAKAKPGAINFASTGVGGCAFVAGELFKKRADINLMHVPYRGGGDALTAVMSGEVSVYFAPVAVVYRQGKG